MFEQSLVESTHVIKAGNRWSVWVSIAIQAAIAAAIVIIPLMHPETIGHLSVNAPQLVLPAPVPPPPPPVHIVAHTATAATEAPAAAAPQAPHMVQAVLHPLIDNQLRPQAEGDGPPSSVMLTSNGMGNANSTGTDLFSTAPVGTRVAVARAAGPVRLSTGVTSGLLLAPIHPSYPPIARAARQEGTVTVHAIISKTGSIESATVTGGPIMLQEAALNAVKQARYRPYLLNGAPTEVDTTISIIFHLNE